MTRYSLESIFAADGDVKKFGGVQTCGGLRRDPSGTCLSISYDTYDDESLEDFREFGDTLRESMSTRRDERRRWKLPLVLPGRFFSLNRDNRREEIEEDTFRDEFNTDKYPSTDIESDTDSVKEAHNPTDCVDKMFCGCPALLFTPFVVFSDSENDAWEWNWANLLVYLLVIVSIEFFLVVGLLIAFLKA